MHTLVEVSMGPTNNSHVPAFLVKLWKLVEDEATNDLISWSEGSNGLSSSFIIKNQAKFARELLPLYYKHNNMASFVRQLNMYGFHKKVSVEQGGLRVDKDEIEFAHPFFLQGHEGTLELIKRKIPATKQDEAKALELPDFNKVLLDVRVMKGRQETMDHKLLSMKRENEALWRELSTLRQKHAKQQQIVTKLLQFLVNMMSSQTRRIGFKRRVPLMLNDIDAKKFKRSKTIGPVIHDVTEIMGPKNLMLMANNTGVSEEAQTSTVPYDGINFGGSASDDHPDHLIAVDPKSNNPVSPSADPIIESVSRPVDTSPAGPVIHDVTEDHEMESANADSSLTDAENLAATAFSIIDPYTDDEVGDDDEQNDPITDLLQFNLSQTSQVPASQNKTSDNSNSIVRQHALSDSSDNFDGHLDEIQAGLDSFRDLLQSDLKIDSSTLLGLFGQEMDFDLGLGLPIDKDGEQGNQGGSGLGSLDIGGDLQENQLVSYNPSLFELTETEEPDYLDESSDQAFFNDL